MKGDVHDSVCAFLLTAGTLGKQEKDIYRRFDHVPRETILVELEALWAEGMVQRFTLGPKSTVWRATDKMNE